MDKTRRERFVNRENDMCKSPGAEKGLPPLRTRDKKPGGQFKTSKEDKAENQVEVIGTLQMRKLKLQEVKKHARGLPSWKMRVNSRSQVSLT